VRPTSITPQIRCFLWVLSAGLLLTACSGIPPLPPSATPVEQQTYLQTQIDSVLDSQQYTSQPGISVLVKKDGVITYKRSEGMADINTNVPITVDTAFEVASIAKPITAIAVMQLVQRQILSLNDSVLKWLPELPSAWNAVTIHHLLSHTSGVPNFIDMHIVKSGQVETLDGINNQQILQHLSSDGTLLFVPGSNSSYSNSNYVLLAEIISRVTAMPYAQYLQENIFLPLGMHSTFVYGDTPPPDTTIALNFGRKSNIYNVTLATVGPFGIFSSISDLDAFVTGLLSGKLISMQTLSLMTSPQSEYRVIDNWVDLYGYGWFIPPHEIEPQTFWHSGYLDGFRSVLKVDSRKGVEFIILCNGGDATERRMQNITYIVNQAYKLGVD